TQRAVAGDGEFQNTVSNHFADVKSFSVWRNTDSVCVVKILRDLDPFLTAGRKIKNLANYEGWCWWISVWAKHRGISTAVGSDHNIIYAAVEFLAVAIGIPSSQLLTCQIEFQDG